MISKSIMFDPVKYENKASVASDPVYNIFIVDEAHKKNMNIELIISIMKVITRINPKVKLMILSATIEEDEDRYFEFFNGLKI